jgi:hypothetical protein
VYPDEQAASPAQFSVPAGHLRIFNQGPNDGTQTTERIMVLNSLSQSFSDCRVVFRLAGSDPKTVKVANGKLEQVLPVGPNKLMVLATVGLPEKSAVQVLATTDSAAEAKYQRLPVQVDVTCPPKITFKSAQTATGLKFFIAGETLELSLTNTSSEPVVFNPQVNLDGQTLIIQKTSGPESTQPTNESATQPTNNGQENGYELEPGKTIKLSIKPALRSIKAGRHLVQVYSLNDPLQRLTVFPIQVEVSGE